MSRPPRAREPLRQAALQLFVENGIHATGIREIAKHANCSEAALYRHWANKDALIGSLFEEHLAEVVALLDDAIASTSGFAGKLRASVQAAFDLYDSQPMVFRFVLLVRYELAEHIPDDARMPQDIIKELMHLGEKDEHRAALLAAAARRSSGST